MTPIRCVLSLVMLTLAAGRCAADDESAEPPIVYTLEVDGQSVTIQPDKPLKLEGSFESPTLTLRVAQTRTLQAEGITFNYPAYFTFEADTSDPEVKTWTASGNDVTLMLFSFAEKVDARALAESTAEALQARDVQVEPVKVKLGDQERAGVKATMPLLDQTVIQQVLTLPATDKGSRLLVLQEVRNQGAGEAAELGATLKVVAASFKVADQ
jgi:hypothetical protein